MSRQRFAAALLTFKRACMLTVAELAAILAVDERTIYRWLAAEVVGGGTALVLLEVLVDELRHRPELAAYVREAARAGGLAKLLRWLLADAFPVQTRKSARKSRQ